MSEVRMLVGYMMLLFMLGGFLGWAGNEVYESHEKAKYLGIYKEDSSYKETRETTEYLDPYGDWVCINVRNKDYAESVATCKHEVGHEIFAEYCEDNIEKCMELANNE